MDLKTYQAAKIQSFFNLGLKFAVTGDQLSVKGFNQYPPDDRAGLQDGIRGHKKEIIAEVVRLQDRLKELVTLADNSKSMTADEVKAIPEEGCRIMDQLPENIIQEIFKKYLVCTEQGALSVGDCQRGLNPDGV